MHESLQLSSYASASEVKLRRYTNLFIIIIIIIFLAHQHKAAGSLNEGMN